MTGPSDAVEDVGEEEELERKKGGDVDDGCFCCEDCGGVGEMGGDG